MKHYWIHNEIAVDADTIEQLEDNGQYGDARVVLCRGQRIDGGGMEHWLDTNGDPKVITLDETNWSIGCEDAAELLEMSTDALREMIEESIS